MAPLPLPRPLPLPLGAGSAGISTLGGRCNTGCITGGGAADPFYTLKLIMSYLILLLSLIVLYSSTGLFFSGWASRYFSIMLLIEGFLLTQSASFLHVGQFFYFCIQSEKHEPQKLCKQGIIVTA